MRRAVAALAVAAIGTLAVGAAQATAQPSGRAPAGELTLVSQDTVSTTPGNTVTFTVAVPANVDWAPRTLESPAAVRAASETRTMRLRVMACTPCRCLGA